MSKQFLILLATLALVASACGNDSNDPTLIDVNSDDETTEEVLEEDPLLPSELGGTAWTILFIDGNPVNGVGISFTSLSREIDLLAMGHTDDCGEGIVELKSLGDLAYDVVSSSYSSTEGCAPTGTLATTFDVGERVFIQLAGAEDIAISSDANEIIGRHFQSTSLNNG